MQRIENKYWISVNWDMLYITSVVQLFFRHVSVFAYGPFKCMHAIFISIRWSKEEILYT